MEVMRHATRVAIVVESEANLASIVAWKRWNSAIDTLHTDTMHGQTFVRTGNRQT